MIDGRGAITPSILFLLWLRLYCHSSTKLFVEKKLEKHVAEADVNIGFFLQWASLTSAISFFTISIKCKTKI